MSDQNNFTIGNQVFYTPLDSDAAVRAVIVDEFIDSVITVAQGKYVIALGENGDGRRVRAHGHELEIAISIGVEYFYGVGELHDRA